MDLEFYNVLTLPSKGKSKVNPPCFRIAKNQTYISFNPEACKMLDIKPGDKVEFAQDKKEPEDWYIFKNECDSPEAYVLKGNGVGGKTVALFHSPFIQKLLGSLSFKVIAPAAFSIGKTPTPLEIAGKGVFQLYPILTSTAKPQK